MGSRLMEGFKLQTKAYKQKLRKEKALKGIPTLKNLGLDNSYSSKEKFENLKLVVVNLLDLNEKYQLTKILELRRKGATYLVTAIECPTCHLPIYINEHWNAFICENKSHPKKIYDILMVLKEEQKDEAENKESYEGEVQKERKAEEDSTAKTKILV